MSGPTELVGRGKLGKGHRSSTILPSGYTSAAYRAREDTEAQRDTSDQVILPPSHSEMVHGRLWIVNWFFFLGLFAQRVLGFLAFE